MDPSGMSTDLVARVPIVIGSIPLRQTFGYFRPAQPSASAPSAPLPPPASAPVQPDNPPAYNELDHGVQPSAPFYGGFPGIDQYPDLRESDYKIFMN